MEYDNIEEEGEWEEDIKPIIGDKWTAQETLALINAFIEYRDLNCAGDYFPNIFNEWEEVYKLITWPMSTIIRNVAACKKKFLRTRTLWNNGKNINKYVLNRLKQAKLFPEPKVSPKRPKRNYEVYIGHVKYETPAKKIKSKLSDPLDTAREDLLLKLEAAKLEAAKLDVERLTFNYQDITSKLESAKLLVEYYTESLDLLNQYQS